MASKEDAPDRIVVVWNAAEAIQDMREEMLKSRVEGNLTLSPAYIHEVAASKQGRFFRFLGRVASANVSVTLRVDGSDETGLLLTNTTDPEFTARYEVGQDPEPRIAMHDDVIFNLIKADTREG